jgi:hypothetical protein
MKALLLLPLLLLLSCDKDGGLRIAIEDSPNADCLKSIFAKDTNFALVKAKKADILVSLDSNLNYKNAKNGNELKYMRQETIHGNPGHCRCEALLGYEIGICKKKKKHASYLAKLSAEEWKLDSNAKGKMYIAGDNRWLQSRTSWISQSLYIGKDSDSLELWSMGGTMQLSNEIDTIAERLAQVHERSHDFPGVEDVYLGNTIFIFSLEAPSLEYLARIANISRKAGYSDIIYTITPIYDDIEINDVDRAKEMLNYIYHQYSYEEHKERKDLKYFSSYIVNLMSSKNDSSIWDFIYGFRNDLREGAFDFETKSTEPVQIVAKMGQYKKGKIGDMSEVLFSFERVEKEKMVKAKAPVNRVDSLLIQIMLDNAEEIRKLEKSSGFRTIDYKDLKISDVEAKGVSFRKMLEDKK